MAQCGPAGGTAARGCGGGGGFKGAELSYDGVSSPEAILFMRWSSRFAIAWRGDQPVGTKHGSLEGLWFCTFGKITHHCRSDVKALDLRGGVAHGVRPGRRKGLAVLHHTLPVVASAVAVGMGVGRIRRLGAGGVGVATCAVDVTVAEGRGVHVYGTQEGRSVLRGAGAKRAGCEVPKEHTGHGHEPQTEC